jgi:hypothetical protein
MSTGTPSCVGSYGHSVAMANSGSIFHTNPKYPHASYPADLCLPHKTPFEDVSTGSSGNEQTDVQGVIQIFFQDEHSPVSCKQQVNHACPILTPAEKWVGIGLYYARGVTWVTIDFVS